MARSSRSASRSRTRTCVAREPTLDPLAIHNSSSAQELSEVRVLARASTVEHLLLANEIIVVVPGNDTSGRPIESMIEGGRGGGSACDRAL